MHGRLTRIGGAAVINSAIGGGTEVELWVPTALAAEPVGSAR
jgi:signal transduction histidine kinase